MSADPDASLRGEFRPLLSGAVLALDVGNSTGWCVYHPGRDTLHGIWTSPGLDVGAHLSSFCFWLEDMISDHRPAIIAMERPLGSRRFTNSLATSFCEVAHMVAHRMSVPRREFTASEVKKATTGNGNADKRDVMAAVRERFGVQCLTTHEADAVAVAVMAWAREAQA